MSSFADLYEVNLDDPKSQLGTGAFSTVHRCKSKKTGQEFAVKVIQMANLRTADKVKIEREAQICGLVHHDNIVKFFGFYQDSKRYYLVFELVSGGELFEEIVTRSFYNEKDASTCVGQILSALLECHTRNIIHRDLKPENLLLAAKTSDSPVKLTDFGLAVFMDKGPQFFGFAGTPGYLAPEVCRRVPYGKPVDVWATGVIMYILLAGYPPFWHEDYQEMYEQIKAGDYDFPSPEWDTVTPAAKELIKRMLDVNADTRITVEEALRHPWISQRESVASAIHRQGTISELKRYNARRRLKGGIQAVMSLKRFGDLGLFGKAPKQQDDDDDSSTTVVEASGFARDATVIAKTKVTMVAEALNVPENLVQEASFLEEQLTKEVLLANERLLDAIANKDWAAYNSLTDTALTAFEPEAAGILIEGKEFHKFFFSNGAAPKATRTTILYPKVRILDNVAIVTYIRVTQIAQGDSVSSKKSEETRVWQRASSGGWVNVHFHRSNAD